MGKVINNIVERAYNKQLSSTYKLSILIGMDSFAYMVCGPNNEILFLKRQELDQKLSLTGQGFKQLFEQLRTTDRDLFLTYKSCSVSLSFPVFTLIPSRLFKADAKANYLAQQTILNKENLAYKVDAMANNSIQNVYGIPSSLENLLRQQFEQFELLHLVSVLSSGIETWSLPKTPTGIYINIVGHQLFVLFYQDQQLMYANIFQFESTKDVAYFALLVLDQFDLDAATVPVHLAGQLLKDSEIYRLLARYLGNLSFFQFPTNTIKSDQINALQPYFHLDLMSLGLLH